MTGVQPAEPVLTGVRVLDLTRLLPGNYATLVLYGLGAEVIKVEDATGDGTRYAPPLATTSRGPISSSTVASGPSRWTSNGLRRRNCCCNSSPNPKC